MKENEIVKNWIVPDPKNNWRFVAGYLEERIAELKREYEESFKHFSGHIQRDAINRAIKVLKAEIEILKEKRDSAMYLACASSAFFSPFLLAGMELFWILRGVCFLGFEATGASLVHRVFWRF